jgi:hypothetical protein
MLMAAFPKPQPPAEDIPIYNGRGCTLLELSQGKCRWPISNPGAEDFCFCGNEPVKGLPYCLGHARIAYRSVGRQAQQPPRDAMNSRDSFNFVRSNEQCLRYCEAAYFCVPDMACMSSEHFGQLAWQSKRMSGSSGLKVQAAIAC